MKNWPLLPSGETMSVSPKEYILEGMSRGVSLLLSSVYVYMTDKILPHEGGLMDQPVSFHEAIRCFDDGKRMYAEEARMTRELFGV